LVRALCGAPKSRESRAIRPVRAALYGARLLFSATASAEQENYEFDAETIDLM
jgi:hypothetical protein